MADTVTLELVEAMVSQLPPRDQLKLVAHIGEQLSSPLGEDYGLEFEGVWEEVAAHSTEFTGKNVRIRVLPAVDRDDGGNSLAHNHVMLNVLAKVEEIQLGMQPKDDKNTQDYLREARSGGMYGYDPNE